MPNMKAAKYCLEDLPQDSPMDNVLRRRIIGEKAMISELIMEKGTVISSHAHENEQFTLLLRGRLQFTLGDTDDGGEREIVLEAGEVMHVSSNVPHGVYVLEASRGIAIYSPTSEKTGIDQ